jgi:DNA-binding CsgD family transcriptional regulator/tetratricopeptide (TPR) repeat protein
MPPATPLIHREHELDEMREVGEAALERSGGVVIVFGAAGIGKTILLDLGLPTGDDRLLLARTVANELERGAALGTLVSALRGCAELWPGLASIEEYRGDPMRYVGAIGELLAARSAVRPILIVIDDFQWADEASAGALRTLVPELSSSAVTWVLACRPTGDALPGSDAVRWLLDNGARRVDLRPLNEDGVHELCVQVLGAAPGGRLTGMVARGEGNPFLITRLLRGLLATDRIVVENGVASVVGEDLPKDFVTAVALGLRRLRPSTLRLLRAGSVLFGGEFTVAAVAGLLRVPAARLARDVADATEAEVLDGRGSSLVFRHDLVREAVYLTVPEPARAGMHRDAALVVLKQGRPVEEAAEHVMRSGPGGDAEAVALLREAMHRIAGHAPGRAAQMIVRALELTTPDDPDRPAMCAEAVGPLVSAGRVLDAQRYGEEALQGGLGPEEQGRVLLGLADGLKQAGRNSEVVEYAQRAIAVEGIGDGIRARAYSLIAHAVSYDDLALAERAGHEAVRLAQAGDAYGAAVSADTALSVVARIRGQLTDGLGYAQHAVDLADGYGGSALFRHARIWLGAAYTALDRFAEAEAALVRAQREAARMGTGWSLPLSHYYYAALLVAQGRLSDATVEASAGLWIAREQSATQMCVPLHALLGMIAALQRQLPIAREHDREMRRLLAGGVTSTIELSIWPVALHAQTRDARAALDELAEIVGALPGRYLMFTHDPGSGPAIVRMALQAEDARAAEAVVTALRWLADRNPTVASLVGAASHAEGLLRRDLDLLARAADRLRESPRPLLLAAALEDTAEATYRRRGGRSHSVEQLEEALAIYRECGADLAVERVETLRKRIGVSQQSDQSRVPRSPLAVLSPTELTVARLLTEGLTKPEVAERLGLSPHTVDTHVRGIYAKLAIRNRPALVRLVTQHDHEPEAATPEASTPDLANRGLVGTDIEKYSRRSARDQHVAQQVYAQAVRQAASGAGLNLDDWLRQVSGDGELTVLPDGVHEPRLIGVMLPLLAKHLAGYNRSRPPEQRVRVRVAVHRGYIRLDGAMGFAGPPPVHVRRLLDSDPVRDLLRRRPTVNVAVIVSDEIYQEIVVNGYEGLREELFREVQVTHPDKEYSATAWVYSPEQDVNRG